MPAIAKITASGRQCRPRPEVMIYIGPPVGVPSGREERWSMASTPSWYFVLMPTMALTHIQKIAPGPPIASAIATPAILPMPTVAATTDIRAWAEVMPRLDLSVPWLSLRAEIAFGRSRTDTIPEYRNRNRPPPIRVMKSG